MSKLTFNWTRVIVKEYNTMFVVVLALALGVFWSSYQVQGISVVPDSTILITAFTIWLGSYILVRHLKKSGRLAA